MASDPQTRTATSSNLFAQIDTIGAISYNSRGCKEELIGLKWNVSQLLKSAVGSDRRFEIDEEHSQFSELAAAFVGDAKLMKTGEGVLVTSHLSTAVWCFCSRCLDRFAHTVEFDLIEEFRPSVDVNTGVQLPRPEDDSFLIDAHHVLDLEEPARQYALLQVPLKPLCSEDCQGFCAKCGANLNEARCNCPEYAPDSRWADLEVLRAKLNKTRK